MVSNSTGTSASFPRLFEPGTIGTMRLRNRIVMAPMGTNFASDTGAVTPRLVEHYRRRAAGGVGLVIVEFTCVEHPRGKGHASQLALHDDKLLAGHADLVDAVHGAGSKVCLQLHHAGGKARRGWTEGLVPVAPSPMPGRASDDQPRVLSTAEIDELVEKFARAVERARLAGYDGVELHGAHGYLLAQFMSSYLNSRTDAYGGSVEGRMRFPLDVIRRARELAGVDFPLTMRFSAQEFVPGGRSLGESKLVAGILEAAGVAALHVSAGVDTDAEWTVDPIFHPQGSKVALAAAIKEAVTIPVIAVGVIREPAVAEAVIQEGKADFVAIGRGLLVDPDWPAKAAAGRDVDIRKCISCNHCAGFRVDAGLSVRCVMNPELGDPGWLARIGRKVARRRRVLVVGGGPAGMEAARVAALRGHEVQLRERGPELGGQLLIARRAPDKEKIDWLLEDLKRGLAESGAEIRLNDQVTEEDVRELAPDVVILACGAEPARLSVPGAHDRRVVAAWDILAGRAPIAGDRAVVIGGASTGCEVALFLGTNACRVTLVEQRASLAMDMEAITRSALLKRISSESRLVGYLGWRAVEILPAGVRLVSNRGEQQVVGADQVIVAVGAAPVRELHESVVGGFGERCDVYEIGDCSRPAGIAAALEAARAAGCQV